MRSVNVPILKIDLGGAGRVYSGAFYKCSLLKDISAPNLTVIDGTADGGTFAYCNSLKELVLPKLTMTLGEAAFEFCANLEYVSLPEAISLSMPSYIMGLIPDPSAHMRGIFDRILKTLSEKAGDLPKDMQDLVITESVR